MIFCVEDDADIREIIVYTLQSVGFEAKGLNDANELLEALKTEIPELILLDIMLPGMDGVQLLQRLRSSYEYSKIPVIMATAKGTEYDKIRGLDLGADDYLVKPFGMMEMVSRVKAVLRRCAAPAESHILSMGSIVLNTEEHTVTVDGERVRLTYKEFELLKLFLSHPGMVFTREQLFANVWEMDHIAESRTVDMHIRTLRQKLAPYGNMIETVRNVGYRMEARG